MSDVLRPEIERPRTGPMRDVVATTQPEQDESVGMPTRLCACKGGAGHGEDRGGLHRVAWPLYSYLERLGGSGMLVVGPNDSS